MKIQELVIVGMSCGHCVASVKKELGKLSGVTVEDVQIGIARITVDEMRVSRPLLASAIERAGYALKEIQER